MRDSSRLVKDIVKAQAAVRSMGFDEFNQMFDSLMSTINRFAQGDSANLSDAMEVVKAQAAVRSMTADEMNELIVGLVDKMRTYSSGQPAMAPDDTSVSRNVRTAPQSLAPQGPQKPAVDPKEAFQQEKIICLECGKAFRVLGNRHLSKHGLDQDAYRRKWAIPETQPLACGELTEKRRDQMKKQQIWKKRKELTN